MALAWHGVALACTHHIHRVAWWYHAHIGAVFALSLSSFMFIFSFLASRRSSESYFPHFEFWFKQGFWCWRCPRRRPYRRHLRLVSLDRTRQRAVPFHLDFEGLRVHVVLMRWMVEPLQLIQSKSRWVSENSMMWSLNASCKRCISYSNRNRFHYN